MSGAFAELIVRLESATEGCRELDAEIAAAVGITRGILTAEEIEAHDEREMGFVLHYTTSIDAALTLVPESIERCIQIEIHPEYTRVAITWGPVDSFDRQTVEANAATTELALAAAALRARETA